MYAYIAMMIVEKYCTMSISPAQALIPKMYISDIQMAFEGDLHMKLNVMWRSLLWQNNKYK